MKHEPEKAVCFQCGMSLKHGVRKPEMLRVNDDHHAEFRAVEFDILIEVQEFLEGKPKGELVGGARRGCIQPDRSGLEGAAIPASEQRAEGDSATVSDEGKPAEPGAVDAAGCAVDGHGAGGPATGAPHKLPGPLHAGGGSLAGAGGRGPRGSVGRGGAAHFAARIPGDQVHGRKEFAGLSGISVSHIYNLRASTAYRRVRVRVEHTAFWDSTATTARSSSTTKSRRCRKG